jgi:hypothetical protein
MQVQELTKKIHSEYPVVWDKLKNEYNFNNKLFCYVDIYFNDDEIVYFNWSSQNDMEIIPFSILYGLLDQFFKENDIYLHLLLHKNINDFVVENSMSKLKKEYEEIQQQAILKACKIMESKYE